MPKPFAVSLLDPCLRGLRQNLLPGLVLQSLALTLLALYAYSVPVRLWLDQIGELKAQWGYAFSAVSTALFGGLIPFGVLLLTGRVSPSRRVSVLLFYLGFWTWKGVEVDALYRAQAWVFGDAATGLVIAKKVAADQLLYNPLWAAPSQVLFFLWKDAGFSVWETRQALLKESLLRRVVVVLFASWVVWIPTVAIVYALPTPLQIPLFNLVTCFWCLLLTSVGQRR